ncbi:hypothetical protein [Polaribacter aquimarinus]|uniref:Uncharacterized protein n=1 Tax=Polaribacter aquimarinus TaxID=2100726 RepID=A0A2U2JA41_9FLAO|nr:hypothetical protein [Polaribacter aquimarinus]PWG05213.1 hypothetical protein DIS07_08175 [Polaribacter aquimarinus]
MIKFIDYKLTKQPDTISEQTFIPNNNLNEFINSGEGGNSRILVIKASNSSGKSFLLNSIAYAFRALELPDDELSPTLRRSLNYLIDKEHQKINFEIDIDDPDGFKINSKFNYLDENEIRITDKEGSSLKIDSNEFSNRYKLLYDIPENPLDRIYKLLNSIKDFNGDILENLNPLDIRIRDILKSIKDERDEVVIKKIQDRINSNLELKKNHEDKFNKLKEKLKDIENYNNLIRLKKSIESKSRKEIEFSNIEKELRLLKPSSRLKPNTDNKKKISALKKEIRNLNISGLLNYCKDEIVENKYYEKFTFCFSKTDINLFNYLFDNSESIVNDLLVYDIEKIYKFLKGIESFKNISLDKVFKDLKSEYNEVDYRFIKDLKNAFFKYQENSSGDEIIVELFDKNPGLIIEQLDVYENKLSIVDDLNKLQKDLNNTLSRLEGKIKNGLAFSKKLSKEITKNKNANNNYDKKLERANNIKESINRDYLEIDKLRNTLEKNGVKLSTLNDVNSRENLRENLYFKNSYCKGAEKEQIEEYKKEIKKSELFLVTLDKALLDDNVKFKVEDSKKSSKYALNHGEIQMFSNKLSFFTRYMVQRNNLISDKGELNSDDSLEYKSYMKIIGEYVASLMGNKIIYQDSNVEIAYIDYSSKTPYFVTPEDKKIAFSDFSGGQGSSNYLKAKLNINEERKFIVLIDEIANMDNKSLDMVIERLKELDENNKLLLAILVEPAKEPKTFNIRAY